MKQVVRKKARAKKYSLSSSVVDRLVAQLVGDRKRITELRSELVSTKESQVAAFEECEAFQSLSHIRLIWLDRAGCIRALNDAASRLFNQQPSPIGRPLTTFIGSVSISEFQRHLMRSSARQKPVSAEVVLIVDGQTFPVQINTIRSRNGSHGYLTAIIDRTEVKSVELNLQRSLESWRALVQGMPDTIILLTTEGRVTYANRAWLGNLESDLVGREFFDLIPVDDRQAARQCFVKALRTGAASSCEVHLGEGHLEEQSWYDLRFGRFVPMMEPPPASALFLLVRDISDHRLSETVLIRRAERLGGLVARTEQIREQERTRIGREIHDQLGQLLSVLKMDLAWVKRRLSKRQTAVVDRTQCMDQALDQMLQTVRRITSELGPPVLLELGLVPAIEWQLAEFEKRFGIRCHVDIRQAEVMLGRESSTAVFRAVQEALTNVARHARASTLNFLLDTRKYGVLVQIEDNGVGIRQIDVWNPASLGLSGMRERITRVDGRFLIEPLEAGGTRVTVKIPTAGTRITDA